MGSISALYKFDSVSNSNDLRVYMMSLVHLIISREMHLYIQANSVYCRL